MPSAFSLGLPFRRLIPALGLCLAAVSAPAAAPAEVKEELEESGPPPTPAPAAVPAPASAPAPSAVAGDSASTRSQAVDSAARESAAADSAAIDSVAAGSSSVQSVAADSAAPADSGAAAAAASASAAASEGPGDLTIEVDESRSRNEGKSLPLAMLYSAVLPGAGELYLQEKGRAKTFLLVEAGFWASLYGSIVAKESYLQSARNHASQYAGIDAGSKDEDFLETMGTYRSYLEKQHRQDSYELAQVLQNKRERDYDIAPVPENYWDFGSSANPENTRNWREFQSTLRYYRASKVAMSFALGALAMNRLASVVNTLQTYNRTSSRSARLEVTPDLGPDYAGTRLTVRF